MFDPADYVNGYWQLATLGVGFYPVHPDKSRAVRGKQSQLATADPIKIRFWGEHCHHRSFAARILRDSSLMVIDTEAPLKYPDRPGPDGELFLGSLLEDAEITLPPSPFVQTGSGGFHRYLIILKGFRIRPTVALFPGIDILAAGSKRHSPRESDVCWRLSRAQVIQRVPDSGRTTRTYEADP